MNLLNLNRSKLETFFHSLGEKSFRAQQLLKWVHQHGVTDFDKMSTFSHALKAKLKETTCLDLPELVSSQTSDDGTQKWLLKLSCGNCIETVYIPEASRGTLCVSSQVGCGLNCSFCSTAKQGFNRNLTTAEIIGQLWFAARHRKVTNVVMMGMGEPLLNFDCVVSAMDLMMDDCAYGLSKRRVTLSTSGLIPQMLRLKEQSEVALAVSLHAPNDELRNVLVPINKKYPVKELMKTCREYFGIHSKRKVTFEYVMLDNVNDRIEHARELAKILVDVPCKVNLIPFNTFPGTDYKRSSQKQINLFRDYLIKKGINTITRKTRGDDIDAACGQLAGEVNDKTSRSRRWQKIAFHPQASKLEDTASAQE